MTIDNDNDPHGSGQVLSIGVSLKEATGAMILLHGRGASASDILRLGQEIAPPGVSLMAPEAANHTWYPYSFLAPLSQNEPGVSSALRLILGLVDKCEAFGIPSQRVAIVGFSQGACLASEFVARYPRRFAGLIAFTGGLLGPPGSNLQHSGSLAGTEVLLSAGDQDPHVPWQRVEETAERFRDMEALVKVDKYPGKPHSVSAIEVSAARNILYSALTY